MSTNDLISYLRQMTTFFKPPMCPIERFILECGTDYRGVKRPKGIRKQADKACFKNATNLSLERKELRYVEGLAIHNGLIPVLHAWCITESGDVVDPTWRWPEKSDYRGFVIPRETLIIQLCKNKVYGVLDPGIVNLPLIDQLRGAANASLPVPAGPRMSRG